MTSNSETNNRKTITCVPIVSWLQKIALYETKARLFIIGSNNTQTRFRVLKIDRTVSKELDVIDDKLEYTQQEIRQLLAMIDVGNRSSKTSHQSSLNRTISAFGIVGFVRFLEGYYLILITKRRRVAQLGHHSIYKIEDTQMVYIPSEVDKSNHEETKYYKLFQNVDLSSNFYFSYSYDLSHTLQYNMSETLLRKYRITDTSDQKQDKTIWELGLGSGEDSNHLTHKFEVHTGGVRTKPNWKFVWNEYLLQNLDLHPDWILYICHGFVAQNNISVFGRPIHLTLIAKRSKKFAGTRFLKRGANCEGDVANEVVTEQIVHDASISSFTDGFYTSFVQMRGSIPSYWSQDISKMVPKPTIQLDIIDPFYAVAGRHFNQLFYNYGSPIICLNLVKRKEQKPHESVLSNEFINTVNYLNQFLPPKHQIDYIGFDMARVNKLKDANVMTRLAEIAYYTLKQTGIFQSKLTVLNQEVNKSLIQKDKRTLGGYRLNSGRILQTGIVRVNCVDCLDRTNTAQFALGKVALAFQLYSLGILPKPELEFESDTVRMLEELYEDHGDTLALQYGGSQLVHRIKTYRKIAPLSSHSRDIMQTLSRYYSNAFSDAEKQNVMNLFLGVFQPIKGQSIWDLYTDFYLHNSLASGRQLAGSHSKHYTKWWSDEVVRALPRSALEFKKGTPDSLICLTRDIGVDERTDGYYEQYRPYELTVFTDSLSFNIPNSCKDFMPNFTADYSPFSVRQRPGKRRESLMGSSGSKLPPPPNPSVSGRASTSSASSSASELESDSDDDDDNGYDFANFRTDNSEAEESLPSHPSPNHIIKMNSDHIYGSLVKRPLQKDIDLYKNYLSIGTNAGEIRESSTTLSTKTTKQVNNLDEYTDTAFSVKPPIVSNNSLNQYKRYIELGKTGTTKISDKTMEIYKNYIKYMDKNNVNV
ncbi:polyphosphoinositide phosphatase-like [Oppia nitens]|uniref:polyphosphoinositide phosphatase-like n=1 Tax=Oppia nitens TaxID=1686743 RepID=UPI0023DB335C|nr:polyphosphoinositide phosphatase-like [Oppia nitens]